LSLDIKHSKALKYKQTYKMSLPAEEIDKTPEAQQVRSSSRDRILTTKGQELHDQEAKRNEKAFNKAYDSWKNSAKEFRVKLKAFCLSEDLDKIQTNIKIVL